MLQQHRHRAQVLKKKKRKKKETAPARYLSRYRECEEDSRWEQQVVNMCVCVCACGRQEEEGGGRKNQHNFTIHFSSARGHHNHFIHTFHCNSNQSPELSRAASQHWRRLASVPASDVILHYNTIKPATLCTQGAVEALNSHVYRGEGRNVTVTNL